MLCFCALRSLLRGRFKCSSLWPHIPQLFLGVVLMFICRIDADIGVPQRYAFWYDEYFARELGSKITPNPDRSHLMIIATKGWFSAIVLGFFAVAMISVALISVRRHFRHAANVRDT